METKTTACNKLWDIHSVVPTRVINHRSVATEKWMLYMISWEARKYNQFVTWKNEAACFFKTLQAWHWRYAMLINRGKHIRYNILHYWVHIQTAHLNKKRLKCWRVHHFTSGLRSNNWILWPVRLLSSKKVDEEHTVTYTNQNNAKPNIAAHYCSKLLNFLQHHRRSTTAPYYSHESLDRPN